MLARLLTSVQRPYTANHQELPREVLRGLVATLLHAVAARQPDIWRRGKSDAIALALLPADQQHQIIFHSLGKEYILTTLPWLIGSLGTMVEDATIFVQFRLYGEPDPPSVAVI